jgi:zinc protease
MLQQPLWQPAELDRLRREVLATVESRLPFEQQEELGLEGLDNYIFVGTPLQHLAQGTVDGLKAAGRDDLANFARRYYTRDNMYVASTISDEKHLGVLLDALPAASVEPPPRRVIQVHPVKGRELLILTQASAIASGIHAGFPTEVTRSHADYWPLFVGNVFFGTHRDSFGRLYTLIREERGYNYGNYSYIEYLAGRPAFQFPLPGTPRTHQYFSIWIRPVAHQYVHFLTKGFMFELERLLRDGLTSREVAEARIKARTLYLNYAASKDRQLGYRLDDLFYGMRGSGYLQEMLHRIDAVTADEVNGALRRHLQAANMKFLIVTHPDQAGRLADDIAGGRPAAGKTREEYHIGDPVPAEKRALLERDRQWAAYPLAIARDRIRIVKSEELFRSANR